MGKSIIKNGDFEDDSIFATPWTCPGNCGINSIAKAKTPQSGDNFNYLIGSNTLGQVTTSKKGETYNLTYYAYAYAFDPTDQSLQGYGVQFGNVRYTDNMTKVFTDANVEPPDWPFWQHSLVASDDDIALTFISDNNTVQYLDNVHMDCISCKKESHTGAIVGGVIGGLAGFGLLLLAAAFVFLRVLRPRRQQRAASSAGGSMYPAMGEAGHPYSNAGGSPYNANTMSSGFPSSRSPDTINISSSQGHNGQYGGVPEVHDAQQQDLRQPDTYPAYRQGSVNS